MGPNGRDCLQFRPRPHTRPLIELKVTPPPPDQNAILTHLKAIFSRMKPISCLLRHVGTHFAHKKTKKSKKKIQKKTAKKARLYPCFFFGVFTLISPISPKFGSLDPLGPKRQELPSVPPSAPYEAFNRIKGHPPPPRPKRDFDPFKGDFFPNETDLVPLNGS